MRFVLQTPSLRHLAGVKIVAHLWTQGYIFTQLALLPVNETRQDKNGWKAVEEKMKSKVWDLLLPDLCKKQLFNNLVHPLAMEIIAWYRYHCEDPINLQFLNILQTPQLCWTMHGNINYAKTAELMLKNERLDVEWRYEIACINCVEDAACELFERMGEERRREYVNKVRQFTLFDDHHLIIFFTCTLSCNEPHLNKYFQMFRSDSSLVKRLFEVMVCSGTRATFEYLFTKLNQREKDQVLDERFRHRHSTSSILYYLSLQNAQQQERVFRDCTVDLLLCLLRWPLQSLFVEAAECGWHLMNNRARTQVLRAIISKITLGCRDYDYAQLFWECWALSSAEYQRFYFDDIGIVGSLIETKEEEFIQLILKEAPSQQILSLCNRKNKNRRVLMDEAVISEAALKECKQTAAVNSSNEPKDVEKRLRSEHLTTLVDVVMENRKRRL